MIHRMMDGKPWECVDIKNAPGSSHTAACFVNVGCLVGASIEVGRS